MKYCPRTVALHKGRVVYDGPSAALTPALLRDLYGAEADDILALPDHISALIDAPVPDQKLQNRPLTAAVAASI
jgi:phosphonate transport system ATP-binding protein